MNQPASTVPVENLDQFVRFLAAWHAQKCEATQHLLSIPEGSTLSVGDGEEAKEITLTGDALAGFKLGVEMAFMGFRTLPFDVEFEDAAATPENAAG